MDRGQRFQRKVSQVVLATGGGHCQGRWQLSCHLLVVVALLAGCTVTVVLTASESMAWSGPPASEAAQAESALGGNAAQDTVPWHPNEMPPLTLAGPFPRFTDDQLRTSGYPDHLHAFNWADWTVLMDADGVPYGPGSLCQGRSLVPQEDLQVEPGRIKYRQFELEFNEGYDPCDLLSFIELCELGRAWCRDLLGLVAQDKLLIINPDNTESYRTLSGLGTWHMFDLVGDTCLVQPIPVLGGRTLIGHAAVSLVTRWTLQDQIKTDLPPWFTYGLAAYLADEGVHLNNYMAQFRPYGSVLLTPAQVNEILSSPPHPDQGTDRQLFRQANYSAFLMAWQLVEHNGGLASLRDLLADLVGGQSLENACQKHYHTSLVDLEARLDPVACGEPIGDAVEPRKPHLPPQP